MIKVEKEKLPDGSTNHAIHLYDTQTIQPLVSLDCKNEEVAKNLSELLKQILDVGDVVGISEPFHP